METNHKDKKVHFAKDAKPETDRKDSVNEI